ncbi:S28 family serine protease [Nocardiopsis baichengensis]|uniref:S28 family serine protease n=1 Tax=Nocardiopsis baichengensis TaxID=280240 RepID=UPI00034AE20B|nr:S28 family serine protease [Nocardiopsis baichengensis]WNB50047.1 S28 family serine protease [Nocardiopsis baichengensis]
MRRPSPRLGAAAAAAAALLAGSLLAPAPAAAGPASAASADPAAASASDRSGEDILDRLLAVPGMRLIEEKPAEGHRFFVLAYTQPVDHRDPGSGTFEQRLTVLHRGTDRPTVFSTSGYDLPADPRPSRSEPARIADANQVSLEYRFFGESRPDTGSDWSALTSEQAADDQHRIFTALDPLYPREWIATGGSKGGMTAVFYERFHPGDMDGVVAYVAPNDADRPGDRAYERMLERVGTAECRQALEEVQVETLERRESMVERYEDWAERNDASFDRIMGSADKALEAVVRDLAWGFWQSGSEEGCASIPSPDASDAELWSWLDRTYGVAFFTDEVVERYSPYYYQAGTELGDPRPRARHLDHLLRYPDLSARDHVPAEVEMGPFDPRLTWGTDFWVRARAENMLFVYGENDPWSAERYRPGRWTEDSHAFEAPGTNHYASILSLDSADEEAATAAVLRYAGVDEEADERPIAPYDAELDGRAEEERAGEQGMPPTLPGR